MISGVGLFAGIATFGIGSGIIKVSTKGLLKACSLLADSTFVKTTKYIINKGLKGTLKQASKIFDSIRKSLGSAADVTIGFTKGTGQFPFHNMGRANHASRHLTDAGLLPNWNKSTYESFKKMGQNILENPLKTFDHKLGEKVVKGFYGKVDGKDVVFFIFKEGKHQTQVATSVIPTPTQMKNWGLK